MSRYAARMSALFSFPDPVNEKAARLVAAVVAAAAALTLLTGWYCGCSCRSPTASSPAS